MKSQNQEFTLKQREAFAKLLAQAKAQVQKEMESDWGFNSKLEKEIAPKLAEEYGAGEPLKRVHTLIKELDKAKAALRGLGFDCDNAGDVTVANDAPKNINDALEKAQNSAKRDRQQTLRKFDLAMVGVLASQDVMEARKIVEELL